MDAYERLREILDSHPSTAPKTESINEILRILFTPEEAVLAVNMSYKAKSVSNIAKVAEISESEAKQHLESMANKGIIYSKNKEGEIKRCHHWIEFANVMVLFRDLTRVR